MSEKPLERLNFFNGQRLQADDFQLEQDYHVRVRRWLNRSLYTPGIAMGLAVYAVPGAAQVRVEPGLAIDHLGREIILLDSCEICIIRDIDGQTSYDGPYLVIRYHEEVTARQNGYCAPAGGDRAAQGGPSRVLEEPIIECVPDLPHEYSGKILLGRIELATDCGSIKRIDTSVRRGVEKASTARVRQYALEGERDIDSSNPGRIYFHIRGQPNMVTLYLRSRKMSSLYYTELGRHNHTNSAAGFKVPIPQHRHRMVPLGSESLTDTAGAHTPAYSDIRAYINGIVGDIPVIDEKWGIPPLLPFDPFGQDRSLMNWVNMRILFRLVPGHQHSIPSETQDFPRQEIPVEGTGGSSNAGVSDIQARVDNTAHPETSLTYVDDLHVWIGPDINNLVNITEQIKGQLQRARSPDQDWTKLGAGPTDIHHAFIVNGTGPIKLNFLGIPFREGEFVIELRVANGGGRIHYNLYIE